MRENTAESLPPRQPASAGRKRLGDAGERLAATWLEARGYRIVARNWRCVYGELDVVTERDGEVVFVEVKTRRGASMGAPEEAITRAKRQHLIAAAQHYLAERHAEERPFRIDVIAIALSPAGKLLAVRHYPACVGLEE